MGDDQRKVIANELICRHQLRSVIGKAAAAGKSLAIAIVANHTAGTVCGPWFSAVSCFERKSITHHEISLRRHEIFLQ